MYLPPRFRQDDAATIRDFVRAARLASLVTARDGVPQVSHVPMLLSDEPAPHGTLLCHLARANPQVRDLTGPVLVAFLGDDAYVRPGWYESKREHGKVVPTWHYVAVHVRGRVRTIEEPGALRALVERLTDAHEGAREERWQVGDAPDDYIDRLVRAIVGVEIRIDSIEGKWKLGQDKSTADFDGVVAGLDASVDARDRSAARRMRTVKRVP